MRELVKQQLKQVAVADLRQFDSTTNTFFIKRYSKPVYSLNTTYIIKVAKELVGNKTSILATNWNNGGCPGYQFLKAYVSKVQGKMIYVDAGYYDYENKQDLPSFWSGWLDIDYLEQLEKI